jgi:guanine nucleotide-binding protein subunit alpha
LKLPDAHSNPLSYLGQIGRILAASYVPNDDDAINCIILPRSDIETVTVLDRLSLRFIQPSSISSTFVHNSFQPFGNHFIVYVFDLGTYDQVSYNGETELYNTMVQFQLAAKTNWLRYTYVIALLNNLSLFREKLLKVRIGQYFPQYTAEGSPADVYNWILSDIKNSKWNSHEIHCYSTEGVCSEDNLKTIWNEIQNTFL